MDIRGADTPARSRAQLLREGVTERGIARRVADGTLRLIHRGWYVEEATWMTMHSEARHVTLATVVAASMRGSPAVLSHLSAAALWGLPLFRVASSVPHLSGDTTLGRVASARRVARHGVAVSEDDRTVKRGIPCTALDRTVFDVIRTTSLETAISCADAALRLIAWDETSQLYDAAAAEEWRERLGDRIARAVGARGIRQARVVVGFADGRAQLPGESVSRLYLEELGFAPPRLQVAVPGPAGRSYRIDFGLDDVEAWGEFDGTGKYTDPAMLGGVSGRAALLAEKRREDWIRGSTQRRMVRWGMPALASPAALAQELARSHIFPPR